MLEGGLSASKVLRKYPWTLEVLMAEFQLELSSNSDAGHSAMSIKLCLLCESYPLNLMGLFVKGGPPMFFYCLVCIQYHQFLSTRGACWEVVFEFECRATSFDSLKDKLILALFGMPKLV
jgi:hypothetical protein